MRRIAGEFCRLLGQTTTNATHLPVGAPAYCFNAAIAF